MPVILLTALAAGALYVAWKTPSFPKKFIPVPALHPRQAQTPSGREPAMFSHIDIQTVRTDGDGVRVDGSTDLPDGSLLTVDFDVAGPQGVESEEAVSTTVTVRKGTFSARLVPPGTREFAQGPYRVDVLFSPRMQNAGVLGKVGADGSRLGGEHARDTFGFKVLEATKMVDIRLAR